MVLFLIVFCMMVALGFGIAAAVSDFKTMTIPNLYSGLIILAFIPAYAADAFSGAGVEFFFSIKSHLIAAAVVFAISFLLFSLKMLGAGDSKLLTALSLWVGVSGIAALLAYMAIIGAVLGIATKVMHKKTLCKAPAEGSWIARAQAGENRLPYGIAIAAGAAGAFIYLGFFSPDRLALLAGGGVAG